MSELFETTETSLAIAIDAVRMAERGWLLDRAPRLVTGLEGGLPLIPPLVPRQTVHQ